MPVGLPSHMPKPHLLESRISRFSAMSIPRSIFPIAALDIETDNITEWSPRALQRKQPLLVGLLIAHSSKRMQYNAFPATRLNHLRRVLAAFRGTVVTYNGLRFDYHVLAKKLNMKKLLPRSFDLFYWLKSKVGRVKGSRLEDLAQENLGRGKVGSWQAGYAAWKRGNKAPMRRYNRYDCELTLLLVFKLLKQGFLTFKGRRLALPSRTVDQIAGKAIQVPFDDWVSSSEFNRARDIQTSFEEAEGNYWEVMLEAMGYDQKDIQEVGVERLLASHSGTEYVHCSCGKYYSIVWTEWPGFRSVEDVLCPNPECRKVLCRHDADHVSEISRDEYFLRGLRRCPKHNVPLKFIKHYAYKPGSEEWDIYKCPRCSTEFQI